MLASKSDRRVAGEFAQIRLAELREEAAKEGMFIPALSDRDAALYVAVISAAAGQREMFAAANTALNFL